MNWHIITGILIVGIILGLVVIIPLSMKQNENPEIKVMESQPVPEERIIASFGLDENNPDRTVFLKTRIVWIASSTHPKRISALIITRKGRLSGMGRTCTVQLS